MRARWLLFGLCVTAIARGADVPATPSDYEALLSTLGPGDKLVLAGGDYTEGMNLFDMNGADGSPIVIAGPSSGSPARFVGQSGKNTIDIRNSSYVVIQNLVLDGQDIDGIDAIKAGGAASDWAHHITIEGCIITGHDGGETSQQTVGISTKIVAWDWVIRGNVIDGAGTGAYLGNSDGNAAFIGGVIEGNLFKKTLGYNMQVKQQNDRGQANVPSVPTDDRVTIIRHNVFIKQDLPSPDGARPNLLADGFPDSGPGSNDRYEIYGNFFYHNQDEPLFQGNGRIHMHDNVFVDSANAAVRLVDHSGKTVIDALVYNNTVFDTSTGIAIGGTPSGVSLVTGNAIFTAQPVSGVSGGDNVTGAVGEAATYFTNPVKTLGQMDFYPVAGSGLHGAAIDISAAGSDVDHDRDFNGTQKDFTYRGAYHGEGVNPGWALTDGLKPFAGSTGGGAPGGTGGSSTGGASNGGTGGVPGNGGNGTGAASGSGGGAGSGAGDSGDDGGCGCRTPSGRTSSGWLLVFALGFLLRRRR